MSTFSHDTILAAFSSGSLVVWDASSCARTLALCPTLAWVSVVPLPGSAAALAATADNLYLVYPATSGTCNATGLLAADATRGAINNVRVDASGAPAVFSAAGGIYRVDALTPSAVATRILAPGAGGGISGAFLTVSLLPLSARSGRVLFGLNGYNSSAGNAALRGVGSVARDGSDPKMDFTYSNGWWPLDLAVNASSSAGGTWWSEWRGSGASTGVQYSPTGSGSLTYLGGEGGGAITGNESVALDAAGGFLLFAAGGVTMGGITNGAVDAFPALVRGTPFFGLLDFSAYASALGALRGLAFARGVSAAACRITYSSTTLPLTCATPAAGTCGSTSGGSGSGSGSGGGSGSGSNSGFAAGIGAGVGIAALLAIILAVCYCARYRARVREAAAAVRAAKAAAVSEGDTTALSAARGDTV